MTVRAISAHLRRPRPRSATSAKRRFATSSERLKRAKSGRCRTVWRMGHVRPFAALPNPRPYAKRAPGPTGPGRSFERVSSTRRATLVQSNRAPPINVLRSLPIAAGRRFRCLKEGRRRAVSPSNALRKRRRRDATAIGRLLEGERFLQCRHERLHLPAIRRT
jgi:hypothetical protein